MEEYSLENYLQEIKKERNKFFRSSFERAYQSFCELKLDKKNKDYFKDNASAIVEKMREQCWNNFLSEEIEFTKYMMKKLICDDDIIKLNSREAIEYYIESYPEYIYQLNLSNTQSRRSRAGKEFEDIIELLLLGAGIPMDSQGNLGKESFIKKGLGKLVDAVSPGVIEFEENKRNTVLISAKTSLRERWQEVPEEMGRTGAREMFLVTLDEKISDEVFATLYEANIQVTTTKSIKETKYPNNRRVLSFEQLLEICETNSKHWDDFEYTIVQIKQAVDLLNRQIEKHEGHDYVVCSLKERLDAYEGKLKELKGK